MMDVKLRGNTISYALPYRRKKNGEPVSVRGKRLGERFTVSGITECLEQKERKRIEYQRIEDIFYGAAFEQFNREWQGEEDDKENSFTDKEEKEEQPDYKNMPLAERVAILPEPTEDVMEELRMYEKRMGYDKDTMRSMRYQMSMYDEFLEEYEARKKQWGTEKVREFERCKHKRSR